MSPTLGDLPEKTVDQLAHLLQFSRSETSTEFDKRMASTLPNVSKDLKHKARLLTLFSADEPEPEVYSKLCALHRRLSTALIHEIFTLVSLEVGHNCNSLIAHHRWLTPYQHTSLQHLRELHSLWLLHETYRQTFLTSPNTKWEHVESGCEGCILTHIGSDLKSVCELRTLLLSRQRSEKRKARPLRLLAFVEGWIVGLLGEGEKGRIVMRGTRIEGEMLKNVRKRIREEKRQQSKRNREKDRGREDRMGQGHCGGGEGVFDDDDDDDAYRSDFGDESIDHFKALKSSLVRPMPNATVSPATPPAPSMRPSRDSSLHVKTKEPSRPDVSQTPNPPSYGTEKPFANGSQQARSSSKSVKKPPGTIIHRPAASSVYSTRESTYEPPRRGVAWGNATNTDADAENYHNLLSSLEEPEPPKKKKRNEAWENAAKNPNLFGKTPSRLVQETEAKQHNKGSGREPYRNEMTPRRNEHVPKAAPLQEERELQRPFYHDFTRPAEFDRPVAEPSHTKRGTRWSQFYEPKA